MFSFQGRSVGNQTLEALKRSLAIVEFTPTGNIITANDNFSKIFGYPLSELKGKHHRLLVEPDDHERAEYHAFWKDLAAGKSQSAEYKRIGKGGAKVWLQASYNPVMDGRGKVMKVVKLAADVTEQKRRDAEFEGQVAAISKSQAVIHFTMDGIVTHANHNFLSALGYALDEIKGRHHSLFVMAGEKDTQDYQLFWQALNRGEFQAAEYKWPAAGFVDTEIRCSTGLESWNATTEVQPRVQA